jgi:ubiquitin C-terminal hydrolase
MKVLKQREKTHGDFELKAIWIQDIMEHITDLYAYTEMQADQREAIHMILIKLSRIIYGDYNHIDHWEDIAGYSQLVVNRLTKEEKQK